jgi:DNA-binding response OmpR family regulator
MNKLLLVEDDQTIALGLEYSLKQEGFSVKVCHNLVTAQQAIREPYALAILDLSLPDGSGYDLCKEIKAAGDMPVIFLTANDDEVSVVMGLDMGADDYITKPFRIRELVSRIKTVLRRCGKGKDDSFLEVGPSALTPRRPRCTRRTGRFCSQRLNIDCCLFLQPMAARCSPVPRFSRESGTWAAIL